MLTYALFLNQQRTLIVGGESAEINRRLFILGSGCTTYDGKRALGIYFDYSGMQPIFGQDSLF